MAAVGTFSVIAKLTGLGRDREYVQTATTNTPAVFTDVRVTQAVADTAEALELGNIATVDLLIIECITNDVDVDLDYVSAFDADLTIEEGKFAVIPQPAGTVYIKNNDSSEQSVVNVWAIGSA